MPNLYPRSSGYQSDERAFIGPIVPGALRGKVNPSFVDTVLSDNFDNLEVEPRYIVTDKNGKHLADNVSLTQANNIRSAYREWGVDVDILKISTGTSENFFHLPSEILQKNPENNAPTPTPPVNDWKAAATQTKAIRNLIHKTHMTEVNISGRINPDRIQYRDYSQQPGYCVIDVRTLRVIYSSEDKGSAQSYIEQLISMRGNHIYDYRIILYRDRMLYMARVRKFGYKVRRLGEVICIGTKKDISNYFLNRKIESNMKVERY